MWPCAITAVVGKNGLLSLASNSFLSRHAPRDPIMGRARISISMMTAIGNLAHSSPA